MLGFGKKNADKPAGPASGMGLPTQKVMSLSSQGMSEPEIVKKLREEGHSPLEVDRAMKDAMRTGAGTQRPPAPAAPPGPAQPPAPAPVPPPQTAPQPPAPMQAQEPAPGPSEPPQPQFGPQNKFAPTDWGNDDDDMMNDDFNVDKFPAEKKMGPESFMTGMDEKIPNLPEETGDLEPIPFAQEALPKERDERIRTLKDRRRKEIEELTEEITNEKWKDIMSRIQLLEENLEKMSGDMKDTVVQAQGGSPEELNVLKGEIKNQKEEIEETNARIDSLEDVVKSSLTPMLDSVRKFNKMSKAPTHHPASSTPQPHNEPGQQPALERPVPKKLTEEEAPEPTAPPRYSPKAANK